MQQPIIYLITSGATHNQTTTASDEFAAILKLVHAAVAAKVSLIQLREKNLSARVLFELTTQAARITRETSTKLLVNDRADIAAGAAADGVHLTTQSLKPNVIRSAFGPDFLIGASTHSLEEAVAVRNNGADFAVWGPVFATNSKKIYGEPQGVEQLAVVTRQLEPFPIVALGGITLDNASECAAAGASGIAAINLLNDIQDLTSIVEKLRKTFAEAIAKA